MPDPNDEGWSEYRRLVLSEIARVDKSVHEAQQQINKAREGIVALQVKASAWGALGGALAAAVAALSNR